MADELSTTWANLLREMKGPLVEALRWKTVLLAEVKRNGNARLWAGKQITIPIILAPQQGTVMATESSALGASHTIDDVQANIKTAIIEHTISLTTQVMNQAKNDDTSWAQVLPTKMRMAEDAISRVMNEQMNGNGDGLLANVASATGSPGLTIPLTTSGTGAGNPYQLYAGRVIDVLTRSNGADPGQGLRRKVVSYTSSSGNLVIDTTSTAGTGFAAGLTFGSGNVTFSGNEGIYIETAYGNALAGLGQAVATSGTFQGVSKTTFPAWQGTDASPASATDPSISAFDRAERLAMQKAGATPDFYLCDPAVVDKYTQGLTVQARWSGDEAQLDSGFTGVRYRNKVLLPEFDAFPQTAIGVSRDDISLYTLDDGPDWDDKDGSMFRRFERKLPVEAWLVWMVQMGFTRCNTQVKIGNLNQAA